MIDQNYFNTLADWASNQLTGSEIILLNIDAESTDFIRFNGGSVRQAGSVTQGSLSVQLIDGTRQCDATVQLCGTMETDQHRLTRVVGILREKRAAIAEDPYLLINTEVTSTEHISPSEIPDSAAALGDIRSAVGDHDLVGIYTSGDMASGFANSLGQRNWHQTSTFNFDWTFYLQEDKAAKNLYAGFRWDDDEFAQKVAWSSQQVDALRRTPKTLKPGEYRSYLSPAAMHELFDLLAWYSFGLRNVRTKQSPLTQMADNGTTLSPITTVREYTAGGTAPNFQEQGFLRPEEVVLIEAGVHKDSLVSPRSAQEYGVATNGASAGEFPQSLAVSPGNARTDAALERLGTGLYIGNLWYTNFSDRPACRVTGMTRFATFWVEGGEIVAPANVLRFDDSLYEMFGPNLVSLDDRAEVILDSMSYERRSNASFRMPGALVEGMRFTL